MSATDRRLVELVVIGKHRPLTAAESREWEESRQYAINREWRLARVLSLMPLARATHDWAWAEELTREYDRVMKLY